MYNLDNLDIIKKLHASLCLESYQFPSHAMDEQQRIFATKTTESFRSGEQHESSPNFLHSYHPYSTN